MDFLIFAVIIVLVIAFGGIIGAVLLMNRHKKDAMTQRDVKEKAIVKRTDSVTKEVTQSGAGSVDSANSYLKTDYYADFQLSNGEIKRFKLNKKTFLSLHDHEQGYLSYQGKRFVAFEKISDSTVDPSNLTDFFVNSKKNGPQLQFYCEAPTRHLTIPSDKPISCDFSETWAFITSVYSDTSEAFCVLDNEGLYLEIICAKSPNRFEIYYTTTDGTRYLFESIDSVPVERILQAFYRKEDITKFVDWTKE